MKKLLARIMRFFRRRSQRGRAEPAIEISPETQVEIERRQGPSGRFNGANMPEKHFYFESGSVTKILA